MAIQAMKLVAEHQYHNFDKISNFDLNMSYLDAICQENSYDRQNRTSFP